MQCEELMKRDIKFCGPNDTVTRAAKVMRDENIGFIPICDESRRVTGTLTDRDIVIRIVASELLLSSLCGDVMTHEAFTCRSDDDLDKAVRLMRKHQVSRIMCVDEGGKLEGVISLSDIAQHESDEDVAETLRDVTEREAIVAA
jgi:CBS domain-containing protein